MCTLLTYFIYDWCFFAPVLSSQLISRSHRQLSNLKIVFWSRVWVVGTVYVLEVTTERKFLSHDWVLFFFFLPLKWILRGHCHSVFIIGTIVMFYYLGNNNMTRCAAYKSYTFNCCWLLVDFPGVGRQSCWRIRGNKSKKQWNNEVTSQKKALYYDYIM